MCYNVRTINSSILIFHGVYHGGIARQCRAIDKEMALAGIFGDHGR